MSQCRCGAANRAGAKWCSQCQAPLMEAGVGHGPGDGVSMGGAAIAGGKGNMLGTVPGTMAGAPWQAGRAAPSTVHESAARPGQHGAMGGHGKGTIVQEEASRAIAGWLVVLRGQMPAYHDVPIYQGSNVLGTSPSYGPQTLSDPYASEIHAKIVADDAGVVLHSMGRNGTVVNNLPADRVLLKKGDHVAMGKTTFVFVAVPPAAN